MKATVEISLYPLNENYEQDIIDFILRVRKNTNIHVETNGMSTQLFGEYDEMMQVLNKEMKETLEHKKAVFVMKLSSGERSRESIAEVLK